MLSKKYYYLLIILPIIILIDQITKIYIINNFSHGESIPVIADFFNITYVRNKGAIFGIFSDLDPSIRKPFFIILPIIALFIMLYLFKKTDKKDVIALISLSLIMSGAIGNFIDRIQYEYVVDFLDFHWKNKMHYPAFNVADSSITVGVFFMCWEILTSNKKAKN